MDIQAAARKHGIEDADIKHATEHAMTIDDQDDDTRVYLGPARQLKFVSVYCLCPSGGQS